jgi:hypothetical protein
MFLKRFPDGENIDTTQKVAPVIRGDCSSLNTSPMTICRLDVRKGEYTNHVPLEVA